MHIIDMISERKGQRIIFVISFILLAVGIYVMNNLYPVYADDWVYSLFYESNPHRKITGLSDLVVSQYNHYMIWGGRTVAHTIAQLLLCLDPLAQDILNTLAFIALVFTMYKLSNLLNKSINGLLLLLIICLTWVFTDSMFFSSVIWITGSANYLWTGLISLLFIFPFASYLISEKGRANHNLWKNLWLPIAGLLAGWTNENTVIALLFFLVVFFLSCKKNGKKIPLWSIISFSTCLAGGVLLLLAPGNFNRLSVETVDGAIAMDSVSLVLFKIESLFSTLKITQTTYLTALYVIVLVVYLILNREWRSENKKKKTVLLSFTFFITAYLAAIAMIAAPVIAYRTLFFTNILLIVSLGLLFKDIYQKNTITKLLGLGFITLLFSYTCYDYSKKHKTLSFISDLWKERDAYIESEKRRGNYDIVFPTTFTAHPKFLLNEMKTDPKDSRNRFYSIYKGVSSIRSDSTAVMLRTP